jgi:transposase-like protein
MRFVRDGARRMLAAALERFLGTDAGLSGPTITRLTVQRQDEARAFNQRGLSGVDYVYVWADGIHVNIRLDEEKLCLLVLIGVRADGTKQLVALADGYRESTGSWADLLRDCRRRGMRAPVLAVGDGALGFWGALREVFPATAEQRCWFHYADVRVMPMWLVDPVWGNEFGLARSA